MREYQPQDKINKAPEYRINYDRNSALYLSFKKTLEEIKELFYKLFIKDYNKGKEAEILKAIKLSEKKEYKGSIAEVAACGCECDNDTCGCDRECECNADPGGSPAPGA